MRLTIKQLEFYADNGFVFLPDHFSDAEICAVKAEVPALFAEDTPRRVVEKGGEVRSVYGSHTTNEVLRRLSRHPKIVEPAMQIVDGQVYVYQFKINAKVAFSGDIWEWHQDYVFWLKEDSLPSARVINAVIFLDEVNEFNGPLFLIPGSHKEGVIDVAAHDQTGPSAAGLVQTGGDASDLSWLSNLTADLKYSLSKNIVSRLVLKYGIVAPKGMGGSVLFFDGNLVHGSANNISPFDRAIILVTFNSTANVPVLTEKSRPDFLVSRDTKPIVARMRDASLV
jgi:ectoine hydroxylase-related dioxygenase (phytanoyl-CoA dioxygenase family)